MTNNEDKKEERIDKMQSWYVGHQGGIFGRKTREKIITKEGISESSPARNTFWYRQRENVKTALLDLYLFLEEAGDDNLKQVITEETLNPIIQSIFKRHPLDGTDPRKAEIARSLILAGFYYLRNTHVGKLTVSHQNTIHEAVDLADFLAESLKPRGERQYPTYLNMSFSQRFP